MRFILVLLLLQVAAYGQSNAITLAAPTGVTGTWVTTAPEPNVPKSGDRYMVIWETSEPCHECSTRFAVVCYTPNCDVPHKAVAHSAYFETLADVRKFLDGSRRVVGIYKIRQLEIEVSEKQVEIPQEPNREIRYEVKIQQAKKP